MKHIALLLVTFTFNLLFAAVPLKWTVEASRVQPVAFDAVRGETLALEATFNSYGKPLALPLNAALLYQTNGMGSAWWAIPATVTSNRISAVFAPTNDPGSSVVIGFLGTTGEIYRAAFALRFRHGPGATPNAIEAPVKTLDLANTIVINPPWPTTNDLFVATTNLEARLKTYVDGEGFATTGAVAQADSATLASARKYTDDTVVAIGAVTPQIVTNIAASAAVTNEGAVAAATSTAQSLVGTKANAFYGVSKGVIVFKINSSASGQFTYYMDKGKNSWQQDLYESDAPRYGGVRILKEGSWSAPYFVMSTNGVYVCTLYSNGGDTTYTNKIYTTFEGYPYLTTVTFTPSKSNFLDTNCVERANGIDALFVSSVKNNDGILTVKYSDGYSYNVDVDFSSKRDLTDNVCESDTYTPWVASTNILHTDDGDFILDSQPTYYRTSWRWRLQVAGYSEYYYWYPDSGGFNIENATFSSSTWDGEFTAIRSHVAHSNDTFTTQSFVTNAIEKLSPAPDFSTNNTVLVGTITNVAGKAGGGTAQGINLHDAGLGCDWQLSVSNSVFTWTVKED